MKHGPDLTNFNCPPVCAKQITLGSLLLLGLTLSALRGDTHHRYLLWYVAVADVTDVTVAAADVAWTIQGCEQLNNMHHTFASFSHHIFVITSPSSLPNSTLIFTLWISISQVQKTFRAIFIMISRSWKPTSLNISSSIVNSFSG